MKTLALAIIIAGSTLLVPSSYAVLGVGDIVSDPVVEANTTQKNIFDGIKYAWEQAQWADKLATLHNTLTTVRENLQTLVMVKAAIGDPSQIPGMLDQMMLDGALSDSGMLTTLNDLGGVVREGGMLAMQLQYLSTPIDLNGYKNAARLGGLYAYSYNADPLAKYRAAEMAYMRYNGALQGSMYRAQYMRSQLALLNSRLGTATTDAEVEKVKGSLTTADAALQDIEISIQLNADQIQVARTMAVNRSDQEKEAFRAAIDENVQEVEANLELPVEEIATVTPQF